MGVDVLTCIIQVCVGLNVLILVSLNFFYIVNKIILFFLPVVFLCIPAEAENVTQLCVFVSPAALFIYFLM